MRAALGERRYKRTPSQGPERVGKNNRMRSKTEDGQSSRAYFGGGETSRAHDGTQANLCNPQTSRHEREMSARRAPGREGLHRRRGKPRGSTGAAALRGSSCGEQSAARPGLAAPPRPPAVFGTGEAAAERPRESRSAREGGRAGGALARSLPALNAAIGKGSRDVAPPRCLLSLGGSLKPHGSLSPPQAAARPAGQTCRACPGAG